MTITRAQIDEKINEMISDGITPQTKDNYQSLIDTWLTGMVGQEDSKRIINDLESYNTFHTLEK